MISINIATIFIIIWLFVFQVPVFSQEPNKARLIILADMGNEPDEEQQMMHMMMCSNEFDLEGLIAVTGKYLRPESNNPYKQKVHPELFHQIIDAYARVFEQLQVHADGYQDPEYLHSIVAEGQPGYGVAAIGEGKSSRGSALILESLVQDDSRPVYIVVNAGSNTLAQALTDYERKHGRKATDSLISKIRVYENGAQDNAGAWLCARYPELHWIRSNYQTYCYGGPGRDGEVDNRGSIENLGPYTWEPYSYSGVGQHQWALEHIKGNHGPMGVVWPIRQFGSGEVRYMEGGGTVPWLSLMNLGLCDLDHPSWGGYSGRFTREKQPDIWSKHSGIKEDELRYDKFYLYTEVPDYWQNPETGKEFNNLFAPVWRWRRAMFNDIKCRMDWCISTFDEANHHPVAAIDGDQAEKIHFRKVAAGEQLKLDAAASADPDQDMLIYRWWTYPEAGTYEGKLRIEQNDQVSCNLLIPGDAAGKQIHLILEVKDDHEKGSLYDYRRVVINVE